MVFDKSKPLLFTFILAILKPPNVEAQSECLRPANAEGVIPFGRVEGRERTGTPTSGRQVIVTTYQFQCCGTITRWQTYVSPSGDNHQEGVYSIIFQIWRPSTPGIDDGCYVMVGEDRYINIFLPEDDEDDLRGLVNRTVPQPSPLTVQPGDVVGFFVFTADRSDGSIQFNENADMGFDEEMAYYNSGDIMFSNSDVCPFPIGTGDIIDELIRAAPVLSLDIDQILCPTTQSSQDDTTAISAETSDEPRTAKPMEEMAVMAAMISGVVVTLVLLIFIFIIITSILTLFLIKRRKTNKRRVEARMQSSSDNFDVGTRVKKVKGGKNDSTAATSRGTDQKNSDEDIEMGVNDSYNVVTTGASQRSMDSTISVKPNSSYNIITRVTQSSVDTTNPVEAYATTYLASLT